MRITPSINASSFDEVKRRIALLADLTDEFHLDIAAAELTGHQTWANPNELDQLDEKLKLDLHLMLALKPQEILRWTNRRVRRLLLHLEASPNPDGLLKLAKKTGKEVFVVWSTKTERDFIERYVPFIDGILVLAVIPGKAGQVFLPEAYGWLEQARTLLSDKQQLFVDGGVNRENFKKVAGYQPDAVILASAIYGAADPRAEYEALKTLA